MKNLFKNLMLVAVAAMAFTACSQDVNEVNKVEKKTVISGVLNIENDDTRSGFTGSYTNNEGKTVYQSEWDGDEYIRLYFSDGTSKWTNIDADGNFEVEYSGESVSGINFTVCSPDDMWMSKDQYMIPQEQVPSANSVDPYAHILKSEATAIVDGVVSIAMYHAVAYGKMTVNVPEGFDIETVDVSFNGGTTYTIYADYVENNTFWFATEPADVTEFTITAYAEDDSVLTKSVSNLAEGDLRFVVGRVSTFSVSGLEVPAEPVFTSASSNADLSNYTDCYLTFQSEKLGTLILNAYHVVNGALELPVGQYGIKEAPGNFWSAGYSTYTPVGSSDPIWITSGTVTVAVVNNQYYVTFENVVAGQYVVNATFTGLIDGLNVADPRTALALPSNVTISVSGKTITLKWDAVVGADGYKVKMWYPYDEAKEEIVYDTQYVFEAQKGNTTYNFNLYSYAKDDNAEYKSSPDSDWVAKQITTEDTDPKMEVDPESLKFNADGETKEIVVTLKNFTADITVSHGDNEWLTLTPNGNVISVSVDANDVAEKRFDTIVVTAGEFTKEIPVEQAAKKAEGTANSNIFTQCKCVNNMDMGEGWGAKFELSNDEGLFLWLWVIQNSVNQSTGAIATGTYNFHNEWCDYATQPGFVVKKMRLPGSDEEIYITNATMKATLNGAANDLEFGITLEDGTTETYTFSGTVVRAW